MSLTEKLKKQNYDLIDGPVRNHDLLQVWNKRKADRATLYSQSMNMLFDQTFQPPVVEAPALTVDNNDKEEFDFNAGIGIAENALKSFKLPEARLDFQLTNAKSISISYNQSFTREIEKYALEKFLSGIKVEALIPSLVNALDRDSLIVISGVLYAKELKVAFESEGLVETKLESSLGKIGDAKISIKRTSDKNLTLTAESDEAIPIAVKAFRIRFHQGKFQQLVLTTDNRDFF